MTNWSTRLRTYITENNFRMSDSDLNNTNESSSNGNSWFENDDKNNLKVNHAKKKYSKTEKYNQIKSLLAKCGFFSDFINSKCEKSLFSTSRDSCEASAERKRKHLDDETANLNVKVRKLNDGASKVDHNSIPELGSEVHIFGHIVHTKQPILLDGAILRDYQLQGLQWMILLFENGLNGILADEMGLGKTIQVISLLCHLYENNISGPFLIVAPLSTLTNWKNEVNRFATKLPVVLYHGPLSERLEYRNDIKCVYDVDETKVFPIVLTSFDISIRDKAFLSKFKWKYLIIDEGHRLKNFKSVLFRSLSAYPKVNSLLLTGTPLQNNLSELWSLLHFILPDVFDELGSFNEWLVAEDLENNDSPFKLIEEERGTSMISALHKIIRPFMLRRVKADVSIELPPKKEVVIYCPLSDIQLELSMHVFAQVNKQPDNSSSKDVIIPVDTNGGRPMRYAKRKNLFMGKEKVNKSERLEMRISATSPSVSTTYLSSSTAPMTQMQTKYDTDFNILNYLEKIKWNNIGMVLRKIANHPYLLQNPPNLPMITDEEIVRCSGKMLVLDTLLKKLKEGGHKVLIFSNFTSMLNIIEEFMYLRGYSYRRLDGQTSITDREQQIKDFISDWDVFSFLISTRAGGLGINLVSADTVVLFDSDWNPQVDLQAQDRCHRIGQKKTVLVYRFISKGTIEEQIVNRATSKLKLEKLVISKGSFKHEDKMGEILADLEELKLQLNVNKFPVYIHENGSVLSEEEWDALLDRTQV